tara:strand:- start:4639 stop:5772 length:1134 start_codon:yes stop_codon:yes gene_type:complete
VNKEQINTIFSTSECLTEQELLNYVNNNLTNVERNKVEQHTINCKFCSEALEGFQDQTLDNYFTNKNEVLKNKKNSWKKWWSYAAAGAAILLITILYRNLQQLPIDTTAEKSVSTTESKTVSTNPPIKNDKLTLKKNKPEKKEYKEDIVFDTLSEPQYAANLLDEEEINFEDNNNIQVEEFNGLENDNLMNTQLDIQPKAKLEDENLSKNTLVIKSNGAMYSIAYETDKNETIKDTNNELNQYTISRDENTTYQWTEITKENSKNRFKKHQNDSIVPTKDSYINNQHFLLSEAAFDLEYKSSDEGFNYFEQEKYNMAIKALREIGEKEILFYKAQLYIGKAYIKLNKVEKAKVYLQNALQGDSLIVNEAKSLLKTFK